MSSPEPAVVHKTPTRRGLGSIYGYVADKVRTLNVPQANKQDMQLLIDGSMKEFAVRIATALHYFLHHAHISQSLVDAFKNEHGFEFDQCRDVWKLFDASFYSENDFIEEVWDENVTKGKNYAAGAGNVPTRQNSHELNLQKLGISRVPDPEETKIFEHEEKSRKFHRSTHSYSDLDLQYQQIFLNSQSPASESTKRSTRFFSSKKMKVLHELVDEDESPLQSKTRSIFSTLKGFGIEACGSKILEEYIQHFSEFDFFSWEIDNGLLDYLKESQLTCEKIAGILNDPRNYKYLFERAAEYEQITQELTHFFRNKKGDFFYGKIKIHLSYWRNASMKAQVNLPFLCLIDNILLLLAYYPYLDKKLEKQSKLSSLFHEDANLANFQKDSFDYFETFSEALKKCNSSRILHAENIEIEQNDLKESADQEDNTKKKITKGNNHSNSIFQFMIMTFLIVLVSVTSISLLYDQIVSVSKNSGIAALGDLNSEVNSAMLDSINYIFKKSELIQVLNRDYLTYLTNADSILNQTFSEMYISKIVNDLGVSSLYVLSATGKFIGASLLSNSSVVLMKINSTSDVIYSKLARFSTDKFDLESLSEYRESKRQNNFNSSKWYLAPQVKSSNSFLNITDSCVWNMFDAVSEFDLNPFDNSYGITLSCPTFDSSKKFNGVIALDVSSEMITNILKSNLLSEWKGAAVVIDKDLKIHFGISSDSVGKSFYGKKVGATDDFYIDNSLTLIETSVLNNSNRIFSQYSKEKLLHISKSVFQGKEGLLYLISVTSTKEFESSIELYEVATILLIVLVSLVSILLCMLMFQILFPSHAFFTYFGSRKQEVVKFRNIRSNLSNIDENAQNLDEFNDDDNDDEEDIGNSKDAMIDQDKDESRTFILYKLKSFTYSLISFVFKILYLFWSSLKNFTVQFGVLAIICGIIIVYFIWTLGGSANAEDYSQLLLEHKVQRTTSATVSTLNGLPYLIELSSTFLVGMKKIKGSNWNSSNMLDAHFQNLIRFYRSKGVSSRISSLHVALNDGSFYGAQLTNKSDFAVLFRAPGDSSCLKKYAPIVDENNSEYLKRDPNNIILEDCDFDPRKRYWYETAATTKKSSWTDLYTLDNGKLGITFAFPFYHSSTNLEGVFGADILATDLSDVLKDAFSSEDSNDVFIMNFQGALISTTSSNVSLLDADGIFYANQTGDQTISSAADVVLKKNNPSLENLKDIQSVARTIIDPITFESPLNSVYSNPNWVLVSTFEFNFYMSEIANARRIAFLIAGASIFIFLYLTSLGFKGAPKRLNEQGHLQKNARLRVAFDKTSFEYWRHQMDLFVKQDFIKRYIGSGTESSEKKKIAPIASKPFLELVTQVAVEYIDESLMSRDVVYFLFLRSLNRHELVYALYKINSHFLIRWMTLLSILVHIPLAFFKPPTISLLKSSGISSYVILIEGICIFFELFYCISNIIIVITLIKAQNNTIEGELNNFDHEDDIDEEDYALTLAQALRVKFRKRLLSMVRLLLVISIVLIDWFLIIFSRVSIEYYFPIRVFVVVMTNSSVRAVANGLIKTMKQAKNAFIFYFSTAFFAGVTGNLLFRSFLNVDKVSSSFTTIIRSVTSAFVYFSTGDNFSNVVYDAYEKNQFHLIYFIALTIIGTFIVVAFVISSFLGSFRKEFHHSVLKKTQLSRSGFFAGFSVLDFERIDRIEKKALFYFHEKLTASEVNQAAQIKISQRKEFLRKIVNLSTFVDAMEDHLFDTNKIRSMEKLGHFDKEIMIQRLASMTIQNVRRRSAFSNERVSLSESSKISPELENMLKSGNWRRNLFVGLAQPWVSRLITLLVLLQTGALTFYGLVSTEFLDSLNIFFVAVFFVELMLKLIAYSPSAFLSPTLYDFERFEHLSRPEYEVANRVDFFAISISSLSVIALIFSGSVQSGFESVRFVMAFLTVRIFTQLSPCRKLLYPIFIGAFLKHYVNFFVLLLLSFYIFGMYGTLSFSGKLDAAALGDQVPDGSYDTLTQSFLTCYSSLVNFDHEQMYASIAMVDFGAVWYYIFYIIVLNLLSTNISMSLILAMMSKVSGNDNLTMRDLERLILQSPDDED